MDCTCAFQFMKLKYSKLFLPKGLKVSTKLTLPIFGHINILPTHAHTHTYEFC